MFGYVQKMEGVTFAEAVVLLAQTVDVPILYEVCVCVCVCVCACACAWGSVCACVVPCGYQL